MAWVNPSVQVAGDTRGCLGISHPPPGPHKLMPFPLWLLRIMSPACPPARALSPGEDSWAGEAFSPFVLLQIEREAAARGYAAWRMHWRGRGTGSRMGPCKATRAASTPWPVLGETFGGIGDSQPLASGSAKESSTTAAPSPLPRELSLAIPIFNATAPRRAQHRNCSGAARHNASHDTTQLQAWHTGTGLGTSAGLQDIAMQGERRRGVTRTDGTLANIPAKQGTKLSTCWDQIFSMLGPNIPHAWLPSQPRDRGEWGGCPAPAAHRLAREADFHKGINQVLLVALEAKDLPDIVHDGVIHWEGKEVLKAHGSTRHPDGPWSQVGRSREVKPVCTSKKFISQYD